MLPIELLSLFTSITNEVPPNGGGGKEKKLSKQSNHKQRCLTFKRLLRTKEADIEKVYLTNMSMPGRRYKLASGIQ